ncbi:MAG: glyoxalase [Leptolyngbyaceae cyanobacterium bins.302]|nr:glyoxalase [Leptolyngbyaceae cyanobacterium bins.302]
MPLTHTAALLTISTPHFDRLVHFYQQLLDQSPVTLLPNIYAEFQLPGMKLGIFQPTPNPPCEAWRSPTPFPQPPTYSMSLCLEVSNLESAIAHLTQIGFPPTEEILVASHGREIYAYDPDGNWLILHQSYS